VIRFSNFLQPPEPVRVLSAQLVRAATEVSGPLPRWAERYPLCAMSPRARQLAWAAGRAITHNPDHGFAIAERVPADAVGSLWALWQAAPSLCVLHGCYADVALLLLDEARVEIERGPRAVRLSVLPQTLIAVDRAEEDFRAAMQVATWRALLADQSFAPLAVHFTYPRPISTRTHERVLGTRTLRFAQSRFSLEIAREAWERALPSADAARFARLLTEAREQVRTMTQSSALSLRVDALVMELMNGDSSALQVATRLGMSVRTLHRRLADEGHTFRALAAQAQRREAKLIEETSALPGAPNVSNAQRARLSASCAAAADTSKACRSPSRRTPPARRVGYRCLPSCCAHLR
jgi:AraC-like DNA-binding protein